MKKLSLKDVKVQSFVTNTQKREVAGGLSIVRCNSAYVFCDTGELGCPTFVCPPNTAEC